MASFKFGKRTIDGLEKPEKRQVHSDTEVKELKLYYEPSGTQSFYFKKKHKGRNYEILIGSYPNTKIDDAREDAREIYRKLTKGEDPRESKKELTDVDDLWESYLEDHLTINATVKSISDAKGNYKLYIKPKFGKTPINNLDAGRIRTFFTKLHKDKGYAPHNKVLNLFKAMMNKAVEWRIIKQSPITVKKTPDVKRERYLLPDEAISFFKALNEEKRQWFKDYVLLSLLTGARQNNILSMKWENIQFDMANWHIPMTKNGESLNVPLVPEAIDLLQERKREGEYVFQSPTSKYGYYIGVDRPWKELLERAGISDLRLHDLRRSLGSWQANLGASLNIIGKSLGHKSVSTTAIYARLQTDPVRQSMEKATSALLDAGKEKKSAEVVPIKK